MANEAHSVDYRDDKDITEQSMLVRLTVSGWSGRVIDKKITAQVAEEAGADGNPRNVGVYSKRLLHRDATKEVVQLAGSLRNEHRNLTMPWDDGAYRLLPTSLHPTYTQRMDYLIDKRFDAVTRLLNNWEDYIDEARTRLGQLFDADAYPSKHEMQQTLTQEYAFIPVPNAKHFVLDSMKADLQESIKADFDKHIQAKIERTVLNIYARLREVTSNMADKLSDDLDEEDGKPKVFRDTLVTNVTDLLELLPSLNLTGNAEITEIGAELSKALEGVKAKNLRPNHKQFDAEKRKQLQAVTANINTRLTGYFGGNA